MTYWPAPPDTGFPSLRVALTNDGRGPDARLARTWFARLVVACPTHALSGPAGVSAAHLFHLSVQAALPPACLEMAVLGLIGRGDAQTSQTCPLHLGRFAHGMRNELALLSRTGVRASFMALPCARDSRAVPHA